MQTLKLGSKMKTVTIGSTKERKVARIIADHFNCVTPDQVVVLYHEGELANEWRWYVNADHGNICDQGSLEDILKELKQKRFVQEKTEAVWIGMRDGRLAFWTIAITH